MSGLTVKDLQEQVRLQARTRYADDLIKLQSIDLWLDQIPFISDRAVDLLLDLEIRHDRTGFGGDHPQVVRLKSQFVRVLAELLHCLIMTANAAGIDLEKAMLEMLSREGL